MRKEAREQKARETDEKKALRLAGRLANAASNLLWADVLQAGEYLKKLDKAVREYDDHISAWHDRTRGTDYNRLSRRKR